MEKLSNHERAAEHMFQQMRARKLSKDEYIRRMTALDETPEGRVGHMFEIVGQNIFLYGGSASKQIFGVKPFLRPRTIGVNHKKATLSKLAKP